MRGRFLQICHLYQNSAPPRRPATLKTSGIIGSKSSKIVLLVQKTSGMIGPKPSKILHPVLGAENKRDNRFKIIQNRALGAENKRNNRSKTIQNPVLFRKLRRYPLKWLGGMLISVDTTPYRVAGRGCPRNFGTNGKFEGICSAHFNGFLVLRIV